MITKLTKKQELEIPKYIDKWVKKASTPMNHKKAIEYTRKLYKSMGVEEPLIIFGFSPTNTALLCSLFFTLVKDKKLFSQLESQLNSQLNSQLDSQLCSQLRSQLESQLNSQLNSQLDSQLYSQLCSQLRSQLNSQLKEINKNWYLGLWWLVWCGWYEYGKFIGVKLDKEKYDLFINFNSEVHFIIPYKGVAFISEKPVEIKWRNERLHNDNGMVVRYSDDYGLWCLNGINVPDWLVKTPAEQIDPTLALKETNADIQREIIRKVGAERMLKHCNAKTLDIFTHEKLGLKYTLMTMSIGDNINRKYLYFEHASIPGVFYAKPVPPECDKALQARAWILSMIGREEIGKVNEAEILANLPNCVS